MKDTIGNLAGDASNMNFHEFGEFGDKTTLLPLIPLEVGLSGNKERLASEVLDPGYARNSLGRTSGV
jgi:hypothetical protein